MLRALLPSEQQWVFRWLFTSAFNILLGENWKTQTVLGITDGDSQEISQLRAAINEVLNPLPIARSGTVIDPIIGNVSPKTELRRCSVHIVLKGLENYGPSIVKAIGHKRSGALYDAYKDILRNVKNWCFSFAQPGYC